MLAPLTHLLFLNTAAQEQLEDIIGRGKALNSKALACMWTTLNRKEEEQQAATVKTWAKDLGWKTTSGQIITQQHDGCLEGRSTYLIAATERVIDKLPTQFHELNDGCHYLEQTLDVGDGAIKACFTYFTAMNEERKPSGTGAKVKTRIVVRYEGREKELQAFDATSIGPTLTGKKHAFGSNAFAIEATDGITTQKSQTNAEARTISSVRVRKPTSQKLARRRHGVEGNIRSISRNSPGAKPGNRH